MVLFYVMLNFTLQNSVNVTCYFMLCWITPQNSVSVTCVILCYAELHLITQIYDNTCIHVVSILFLYTDIFLFILLLIIKLYFIVPWLNVPSLNVVLKKVYILLQIVSFPHSKMFIFGQDLSVVPP